MTKISKATPQARAAHQKSTVTAPKATPGKTTTAKTSHPRTNSGAKRINYAAPNLNNSGNLPAGGAGGQ